MKPLAARRQCSWEKLWAPRTTWLLPGESNGPVVTASEAYSSSDVMRAWAVETERHLGHETEGGVTGRQTGGRRDVTGVASHEFDETDAVRHARQDGARVGRDARLDEKESGASGC